MIRVSGILVRTNNRIYLCLNGKYKTKDTCRNVRKSEDEQST